MSAATAAAATVALSAVAAAAAATIAAAAAVTMGAAGAVAARLVGVVAPFITPLSMVGVAQPHTNNDNFSVGDDGGDHGGGHYVAVWNELQG